MSDCESEDQGSNPEVTQNNYMKVYIVTICTEDGENYKYAFFQKPSETKIKSIFFKDHGHTYKKKDWKENIWYEIEELIINT
jgi:hypothetical protein